MSNTVQNKTLWKKNLDSKFISGEDLILSVKGLSPEMVVTLVNQKDDKTFDKNKSADVVVTSLYFTDQTGKQLYKPAILNKTNAKFFEKETGSPYIEDWYGRTVLMYAQKDSRHGHVVRFRTYVKPTLIKDSDNFKKAKTAIDSGNYTLEQVKSRYVVSPEVEQLLTAK